MILIMVLLFGFVQHGIAIKCYTCVEPEFFCSLPLNLDGGEENSENAIESFQYDSDYICQSNHFIDPITGLEKIILRGIQDCTELNIINHRIYCCNTNNCNKWLPPMAIQPLMYSNDQRFLPSMIVIVFSISFQYFL